MARDELATVEELTELVRGREEEPSARLRLAIALGRRLSDTGDALIERFVAEARAAELGHRDPSTEHVLAGIVAVPDSMAVKMLGCLGASPDEVRAALAARLGVEPSWLLGPRRRRRRLLA